MGGSGGGYSPSITNNSCSQVNFQAAVNSPQSIVSSLQVGDILQIALQHNKVTVFFNGQVVGALTGTQIQRLVNCINNGFSYVAEVLNVAGGKCIVRVYADD